MTEARANYIKDLISTLRSNPALYNDADDETAIFFV